MESKQVQIVGNKFYVNGRRYNLPKNRSQVTIVNNTDIMIGGELYYSSHRWSMAR